MVKLKNLASVIRSKNSGPYVLTLDIIFNDYDDYQKVKKSQTINQELIKKIYQIDDKEILDIIYYDIAFAIKINIKRKIYSGSIGDLDIYGAQQHSPLLEIDIEKV